MQRAVLVKTCRAHRERLEAVERTWATDLRRNGVPVYWVEGGYEYTTSSRSSLGGMIGTCGSDGRDGLTAKVREGIAEILSRVSGCEYIFTVDDDTFVHPMRWLAHEPHGYVECRIHKPTTQHDRKVNKGLSYITGGPGWYMSREMCEVFVDECHRYGHSNDDVIAARVAQAHAWPLTHRPDLYGADRYTGKHDRVSLANILISCHDIPPREMEALYHENNLATTLVRREASAS